MKTAVQELVEEMEQSPLMFAPALALIKEKNFLEKEKEQIMDAWIEAGEYGYLSQESDRVLAEQYYNETFNINDRHN
jgi:hypothetical protein